VPPSVCSLAISLAISLARSSFICLIAVQIPTALCCRHFILLEGLLSDHQPHGREHTRGTAVRAPDAAGLKGATKQTQQ
jgi:hypothetical protein